MDPSHVATDIASPTNTPETRASQKPPTATRSLPGIAYTDPELYEQELTEVFERALDPGRPHLRAGRAGALRHRERRPRAGPRRPRPRRRAARHVERLPAPGLDDPRGHRSDPLGHALPLPRVDLRARRSAGGGAVRPGVRLPRPRPGGAAAVPRRCGRWPGVLLHRSRADVAGGDARPGRAVPRVAQRLRPARCTDGPRAPGGPRTSTENWKILADNYFEDYHVPVAHPILVRLVDVKETIGDNNDWCEWSRVPYRTRPSRDPREREYQSLIRRMPGMPEEFESAMGHVCIWPTTFFEIYPHHIDMWQLEPAGLQRTRATTMTLVHPDEDEQDRRARELMRELNVDIMGQDVDITTRVQRGVQAPSYHSGILNDEQEFSVIRFQQRLRELLPRIAELEATATGERSVASS